MIKKLLSRFRDPSVEDPYFGKMRAGYDRLEELRLLYQNVAWPGLQLQLILLAQDGKSKREQYEVFLHIKENFSQILNNVGDFFLEKNLLPSGKKWSDLWTATYISIPENPDIPDFEWELTLLNKQDGFSYLELEMQAERPLRYSSRA